jgi:phage N-6-adenine-methyltransferase
MPSSAGRFLGCPAALYVHTMTPTIDPEFQALIPPLSPEEREQLEQNLKRDGCRDPLVAWDGILLDGHNRLEICGRLGIGYRVVEMEFDGREAAKDWMDSNQLGRRNLSPDAFRLLLGRRYNRRKKSKAEAGAIGGSSKDQIDPCLQPSTAQTLATEHGVSEATVKRAGKFAEEVEASPELAEAVASGKGRAEVRALIERPRPHVAHNAGENEWYTPPLIIASAVATMGSIDLDPASSEIANKTVGAGHIFTKEDNGLERQWGGNVWLNPPYAQPLMGQFAEAVAAKFKAGEIAQAIILVNNATETAWFARMASVASAICFPLSRIKFLDPDGKPGAPLQGQAILYMGDNRESFYKNFSHFGFVCHVI